MINTGYFSYSENCWLILRPNGDHVGHGETKTKAINGFIDWYETKKDIYNQWRRLKRDGYKIVKASVTFEYEIDEVKP